MGGSSGDGSFQPLVEPTEPLRGDEDNPVYKWHNDFLATRQQGRAQLQAALHQRATGRYKARTDAASAAGMATTLFGQLNLHHGRVLGGSSTSGKIISPYNRLEAFQAQQVRRAVICSPRCRCPLPYASALHATRALVAASAHPGPCLASTHACARLPLPPPHCCP